MLIRDIFKKVKFLCTENHLVVQEVNLNHENHRSDETTFKHYPENLRLDKKQKKDAKKMIHLGVKPTVLKSHFMKQGKNVALKTLHNLKTMQQNSCKPLNELTELDHLLEELQKIPNARIRICTNEDGELIGNFA